MSVLTRKVDDVSEQDLAILAFEKRQWRYQGRKEDAIRKELRMSVPRYYQALSRLIHDPEAYAAEPTLIKRLRRIAKVA